MNKELILHYYGFDWDDNILFMPTTIIVLDDNSNEVEIETHEFAQYRDVIGKTPFDFKGQTIIGYPQTKEGTIDYEVAFRNFRDYHDPDTFINDTKHAITDKSFGPSWSDFLECLTTGSLFAIITARGHETPVIRRSVEHIIDTFLTENQQNTMYHNLLKYSYLFNRNTDYDRNFSGQLTKSPLVEEYLGMCEYIGVSAPSRLDPENAMNPEKAKLKALMDFKTKVNRNVGNIGMKARIGFSDDDVKTVKVIEGIFNEINHEEFPNIIQWIVKNTSDPNNITKTVNNRK
tara:strand:+ start:13286 stop:14152 length:867 start_codon:yes stop_codon:yes gene_type:complete